jgi:transposase InsO family protein
LKYIALKTDDGRIKGKIRFYCFALKVSRQAFYDFLKRKDTPWKYQTLADAMINICKEDECNEDYGRVRMYQALKFKKSNGEINDVDIPSESTVRKVMTEINIHRAPKRKPNGITKVDRTAQKSDDLIKRDFTSDKPLEKCFTDITEIKGKDGKLYVSAIFDSYDLMPNGLAMADNMRAELCVKTLKSAYMRYPDIRGAIIHSDRGSQYTSSDYRSELKRCGIIQSMNSAGGRCHDNARCESIWARMKEELFYNRKRKSENYTIEELKVMVWRYFMGYWSNRRICSSIGGIPPIIKRQRFYSELAIVA